MYIGGQVAQANAYSGYINNVQLFTTPLTANEVSAIYASSITSNILYSLDTTGRQRVSSQNGAQYLALNADNSIVGTQIQSYTIGGLGNSLAINPYGGAVGIGTTAPQNTLQVVGNINITSPSTAANNVLTANVIANAPLATNALDTMGNLVVTSTASATTYTNAAILSKTVGCLNASNNPTAGTSLLSGLEYNLTNYVNENNISVSVWFNTSSLTAATVILWGLYAGVVGTFGANNGSFELLLNSNGSLSVQIYGTSFQSIGTVSSVISTGTWYNVIVSFAYVNSTSSILSFYINGVSYGLVSTIANVANNNLVTMCSLTHRSGISSQYVFTGYLSNFTIYNSVLTAQQIAQIVNTTAPITQNAYPTFNVLNSGSVGIGSSAPQYPLDVANNPVSAGYFRQATPVWFSASDPTNTGTFTTGTITGFLTTQQATVNGGSVLGKLAYNSTTGYFTPTIAGLYYASGSIQANATGMILTLSKNNTTSFAFSTSATSAQWVNTTGVVYLNGSTDFINFYMQGTANHLNTSIIQCNLLYSC